MNPYHLYYYYYNFSGLNYNIHQESFYYNTYVVPVPVPVPAPQFGYDQVSHPHYTIGAQSVEYLDEVAILNTPNTRSPWVNQQPMQHSLYPHNHYLPYPTPEDTSFNPSFVRDAFEEFLEESLIMDELETDLAQQGVTDDTSGSGLSVDKISEHLRVYKITTEGEEGDSCCICLGEYGKKEKIGVLECGHRFHEECIKRWLLSKNVCPMCRSTALNV
ncbi:hypothetical protein SSX86_010208 [Deinandra increscens subsp. villosa]|uniref:RING-type E3 ubiquitin transferase n=1 Tax=Deinandra increscens subsp. villosa TaxID=3103831 RepID=A0AAP0DC58_9ASTR